ncbi:MAG: di-heme oxidoredictase family protein [Pseudomonadota bacterium]
MRNRYLVVPGLFVTAVLATASTSVDPFVDVVHAPVVATGIPGVGAIAQIAAFHRGSPVHDKPAFSAYTQPGRVLDGARLFVASSSNYGAPLGNPDQYAGTILSIDPSTVIDVPADFALAGDQASALNGAVRVYSSNSTAFFNARFNPLAVTANQTGVSLPLGISTNNGHGRPWIASAPYGAAGNGKVSVLDPVGAPLAGAPNPVAGGIFMGDLTNRNAASTHGLTSAAIGTAIISKSSDRSNRAVFAAVGADGSIVQIHVQKGVDGLLPPGTLTPLTNITPAAAASNDPLTVVRAGIAFNWAPNRVLYVADPLANRVVAVDLTDDGVLFKAAAPRLLGAESNRNDFYNTPVDVVPAVPEVAADNFSSNSTLAVGADLYVLNRGNNSVVRITQDGQLVGKRFIVVDDQIGFRAAGLGVSPDGQTIWVTGQTKDGGGIVVKLAAFGSGPIMSSLISTATTQGATTVNALGEFFFKRDYSIVEGVGPLFNAQSCVACHGEPNAGGMSASIVDVLMDGPHGPTARAHSIAELGSECTLATGPIGATNTSVRSSMTLRSTSLIDFVQPHDIILGAAAQAADVRGRVNYLADGRVGRFGWKANVPTLIEFMGGAYRNEMGLTNGLERNDLVTGCGSDLVRPELDAVPLVTTAAFLATVDAPAPSATCTTSHGATVFKDAGCTSCHRPSFPGPGGVPAVLYSDLLLHDMGPDLADGLAQESATGSEFRTMTLVAIKERSQFLHDGRAKTVSDAIFAHGGQATASKNAVQALSPTDQSALVEFLQCL